MLVCLIHLVAAFALFLISSLEREEAEDLIKRHGGRVTGSVSKKTVIIMIISSYITLSLSHILHGSCRTIYYVMKILVDGSLPKPKSSGKFLIFIFSVVLRDTKTILLLL